jgi:hypothetical protein
MATSTTNLITAANAILLNINERTQGNLSSLLGLQVKGAIASSLNLISNLAEWSWLKDKVNANWSGNTATISGNVANINQVLYHTTDNYIPVVHVSRYEFDRMQPLGVFTTATDGYPRWWTMLDLNSAQFNPYPTTITAQNYIYFYIQRFLSIPTTETGLFAMPEFLIPLLIKRATAELALSRLEDANLYGAYISQYEEEAQLLRNRQRLEPGGTSNAYKGGRYGRYIR